MVVNSETGRESCKPILFIIREGIHMNMSLRWYGPGYDTVTLEQIRQIPGVKGVITTLYGTRPGEVWEREEIRSLKKTVEEAGLSILGIESVNVHDDIKTGAGDRDRYIENYIKTLERSGRGRHSHGML